MQTKIAEKTTDTQTENGFEINEEIQKVLDWFYKEEYTPPLFLSGKAGTGKSTLIRHLIELCKEQNKHCAVVAPTGVAAYNIGMGASTIHSYFKLPILPDMDRLDSSYFWTVVSKVRQSRKIDFFIIDEVPMVKADLFDMVDSILRQTYNGDLPFGGIKVLLCGDLYQLPPILRSEDKEKFLKNYKTEYFFGAAFVYDSLEKDMFQLLELKKVYRQKDQHFIDVLNRIRVGAATAEDLRLINKQVTKIREYHDDDQEFRLHLCTTNAAASAYNEKVLDRLPGEIHTSKAKINNIHAVFPKSLYPTDVILNLKVGAQVMFIINDPSKKWVNGTLGRITEIHENGTLSISTDRGGVISVTKHIFSHSGFHEGEHTDLATFEQYPFRLAWSVTIHKSQGLTFDKISIDFGKKAFAAAMVYVALSRCRTLEGIQLVRPVKLQDIIVSEDLKGYKKYFKET